jgi:hypothetical protein
MSIASASATVTGLIILGVTYATLNLWLSVGGDIIDITAWGMLVGLSIKNRGINGF